MGLVWRISSRLYPIAIYGVIAGVISSPCEASALLVAQRGAVGGLLSLTSMWFVAFVLGCIPARLRSGHWYIRPKLRSGSIFVAAGAVAPVVLLLADSDRAWPWPQVVVFAAWAALGLVVLYEIVTAAAVRLERDGLLIKSLWRDEAVTYDAVAPGPSHVGRWPLVGLLPNGHLRLPAGLRRCGRGETLADRHLYWVASDETADVFRSTTGLARVLGRVVRAYHRLFDAADIGFDTHVVIEIARKKRCFGASHVIWLAVSGFFVLWCLGASLVGLGAMWPIALVPLPLRDWMIRVFLKWGLLLLGILSAIYWGWFFRAERDWSRYLVGDLAWSKSMARWASRSKRAMDWILRGVLLIIVVLWFHMPIGAQWVQSLFGGLGAVAAAWLAYLFFRYWATERRARVALCSDDAKAALDLLCSRAPKDERAPWQGFKALALAKTAGSPERVLSLAVWDLMRPAEVGSFLAAASSFRMSRTPDSLVSCVVAT